MKNLETILNVGEDATNYISIDNPNEIRVFFEQILPKLKEILAKQVI